MLIMVALVLFALAAVVGIVMLNMYVKDKLSVNLALVHGLFGASGLIVLIIAAVQGKTSMPGNIALAIFVIAALGGFILLFNHLTKGTLPKLLIPVHAIAAVIAFMILLVAGFKGGV